MSRKQIKRRTGGLAKYAIVGFFILVVACGVGFTAASADSSDKVASANAFGFDAATHAATAREAVLESSTETQQKTQQPFDNSVLKQEAHRSLDAGFQMIDYQEALIQQRIREENERALNRVQASRAKQGVKNISSSTYDPNGIDEYNLSPVNWFIGKEAFLQEWTRRIDEYLAGSNLAGYGAVFAECAWNNGVDPRLSPAIANTESGLGSRCFLPYNAWGWGYRSWGNWTSAIVDHVAGLAELYGYSITPEVASSYCPPNQTYWYQVVSNQMRLI